MAAVNKASPKYYYCPETGKLRNFPQERAEELAQIILKTVPPNRANPNYEKEFGFYKMRIEFLMKEKKKYDDLAFAVEMALYPQKRKKMVEIYQSLPENRKKREALEAILKQNQS